MASKSQEHDATSATEESLTETDEIPAKPFGEGLNIIVAMQRIERIAKRIKSEGKAKVEYLEELDEMYYRTTKLDLKKMLGDHIARLKVGAILKKSLNTFGKASKEFQVLLRVLANYSHVSRDICLQQGRIGMLHIMVQCLKSNITRQVMGRESVILGLAILYNCGKENENKKFLKDEKAAEMLFHYSEDADNMVNTFAILILPYVLDEKSGSITAEDSVIGYIVKQLNEALQNKNHQTNGWTASELAAGLKNLSANKDNSLAIVKKGALLLLTEMLLNGDNVEEEIAGETIWMLTFQDENKQIIASNESLLKILTDVSQKAGPAQETAKGTVWLLDSKSRVEEKKKSSYDATKPHIMISYQWDSQELMDRVYEELRSRGYNMWMDIHRMSGSVLESMAEAVEAASIVLVCMSQKYEDSPNCRTEAEYAFNLRKKIIPIKAEQDYKAEGWLGALIGTKLYINFSSLDSYHGETFTKRIDKLVLQIERAGANSMKTPAGKVALKPSLTDVRHKPVSELHSSLPRPEDVREWLTEHNITSQLMTSLLPRDIMFLLHLKTHGLDTFYRFLSGAITVEELREIKRVSDAIDDFRPKEV